uniref:Uncharacterized protein n=1 Tax=Anguilla anguilla TaxID=7936 RepID=A0A0E9TFX8_ANGAN
MYSQHLNVSIFPPLILPLLSLLLLCTLFQIFSYLFSLLMLARISNLSRHLTLPHLSP